VRQHRLPIQVDGPPQRPSSFVVPPHLFQNQGMVEMDREFRLSVFNNCSQPLVALSHAPSSWRRTLASVGGTFSIVGLFGTEKSV
jgi:hypothetical protein